jgi:hypothetical protein
MNPEVYRDAECHITARDFPCPGGTAARDSVEDVEEVGKTVRRVKRRTLEASYTIFCCAFGGLLCRDERSLRRLMPTTLLCRICSKPIALEDPKTSTDEQGKAVHTDCYARRLIKSRKRKVSAV